MDTRAGWETTEQTLEAARSTGFTPSDKQRKDWRRAGLLPRPLDQAGQGRSRGSVVYYPAGTGALLAAVCRHSQPKKPIRDVALLVWWDGLALASPELISSILSRTLDDWERLTAPWAALDEVTADDWAKLDRQLSIRQPPPLRDIYKRSGKRPLLAAAATLLNVAAGGFDGFRAMPPWNADDVRSDMESDLGLEDVQWIKRGLTDVLPLLSSVLNPSNLRRVLADSTPDDIDRARDEVRDMVSLIESLSKVAALLPGTRDLAPFQPLSTSSLTPGMRAAFVLFWLAASRRSAMRDAYRKLLPALSMISALRNYVDSTGTGTTKPPRRLEPSGGTASSVRSTQCTTSLASPSPPPALDTASSH